LPKKFLGQHFLSDSRILARIADALPATRGDPVLEIGPGRGALTAVLAARGFRVTAIERDRDLIPELRTRFPAVGIVEGDALAVDWQAALGLLPGDPWFLIGNIPYQITTPLIERALEPPRPRSIVFLIQQEVADRLTAKPGTAQYGALTVGVSTVATVERLFAVAPGAFHPRPKVTSAVVRITPGAETGLAAPFRRLVVGLFGARRKQLARALRTTLGLDGMAALEVLRAVGLDPTRRPETLTVAEFGDLYRAVVDGGRAGQLTL
jgi:16S rRNA (adenine1518-N6/adenine1519-N6)-dimethyltransferase